MRLQSLLQRNAEIAYASFSVVGRAAEEDPTIAQDVVTRSMVRSAHEYARALARDWDVVAEPDLAARR